MNMKDIFFLVLYLRIFSFSCAYSSLSQFSPPVAWTAPRRMDCPSRYRWFALPEHSTMPSLTSMMKVMMTASDCDRMSFSNKRLAFLLDCNVTPLSTSLTSQCLVAEKNEVDVSLLRSALNPFQVHFFIIPNIFELNDKRYEVKWLSYLHELTLSDYDCVIADSGAAEAMLRYCEAHPLSGSLILLDPPDIYTAAERHGRDFHNNLISTNCHGGIKKIRGTELNLTMERLKQYLERLLSK